MGNKRPEAFIWQLDGEAEKLKTFWRADFCMQNILDDKKVHKYKICNKKVHIFCDKGALLKY